jgi:hypothetical protein
MQRNNCSYRISKGKEYFSGRKCTNNGGGGEGPQPIKRSSKSGLDMPSLGKLGAVLISKLNWGLPGDHWCFFSSSNFFFFYIIKGFLKSLLCFKPKWFANISANINDGDTNSGIGLMVWNEVNVTSIQFGVGWSWNWIIFKPSVVSNLQDHEAIAEVDRFPFLLSCTCFTFCFDKKKGKKKLNQLGNSFSINKTWRIPLRVFYLFILTQ